MVECNITMCQETGKCWFYTIYIFIYTREIRTLRYKCIHQEGVCLAITQEQCSYILTHVYIDNELCNKLQDTFDEANGYEISLNIIIIYSFSIYASVIVINFSSLNLQK